MADDYPLLQVSRRGSQDDENNDNDLEALSERKSKVKLRCASANFLQPGSATVSNLKVRAGIFPYTGRAHNSVEGVSWERFFFFFKEHQNGASQRFSETFQKTALKLKWKSFSPREDDAESQKRIYSLA